MTERERPDFHDLYRRLHLGHADLAEQVARRLGDDARVAGKRVVVVSACLLGEQVRFDGGDKYLPAAVEPLLSDPSVVILPICPEILGGLGCPRAPIHFVVGDGNTMAAGEPARAVDATGKDRTLGLAAGAARGEVLVMAAGATEALLKERSPSCGVHRIHGPEGVVSGRGVFGARLARRQLKVFSEEDATA